MTSLIERVDRIEKAIIEEEDKITNKKKKAAFSFKIPLSIMSKTRKGGVAVLLLRNNGSMLWSYGSINDGLVKVELNNQTYSFDKLFYYGKKKTPVVVILEWRLIGVGGAVEQEFFKQLGDKDFNEFEQANHLFNYGQQTIIRGIEQSQVEETKKKGGGSLIMWILLGAAGVYLVSTFFGGG